MKNKLIGVAFVTALLISTTSFAQKQAPAQRRIMKHEQFARNERPGNKFMNTLTDEQKDAFKMIRMKTMKDSKPLRDQLRELRAHQQTLMTADKPDMKAIYANIDKMSELQTQLAKILAKSRVDMQSHLTDEQKMQFGQMKGMRDHQKRGDFRQRRSPDHRI